MKLMACFQTSGTTESCSVGLCVQMSGPGLLIASLIKPFTVSLSFRLVGLCGFFKDFRDPFSYLLSVFSSLLLTLLSFNMLYSIVKSHKSSAIVFFFFLIYELL